MELVICGDYFNINGKGVAQQQVTVHASVVTKRRVDGGWKITE